MSLNHNLGAAHFHDGLHMSARLVYIIYLMVLRATLKLQSSGFAVRILLRPRLLGILLGCSDRCDNVRV